MRSKLLAIMIILGSGLATNVLVAWGLAALHRAPATAWRDDRFFERPLHDGSADVLVGYAKVASSVGLEIRSETTFLPGQTVTAIQERRGWPRPALAADYEPRGGVWRATTGLSMFAGRPLTTPDGRPLPPTLPIRPVWAPFAVNTLVYAAAAALVLVAHRTVRRIIRRRRGRCLACGYPLGEAPTCSECGSTRS